MQVLSDIVRFGGAVISHWVAIFGIASLAFAFWLRSTKKTNIPDIIFWCVAIICLFLAFFLTWNDEHNKWIAENNRWIAENNKWIAENKKSMDLEAQLKKEKEQKITKLSAQVETLAEAPAGKKDENSIVTVVATIKNTGAPSIADNFEAKIKVGEREVEGIIRPAPRKRITLWTKTEKEGEGINLDPKDFLLINCSSQPIPTGGSCSGFLQLFVPNVRHRDVAIDGAVVLTFRDASNNTYHFQSVKEKNPMPKEKMIDLNRLEKGKY